MAARLPAHLAARPRRRRHLHLQTDAIPAGDYEAKVAVNSGWTENYGEGGAQDGANIPFTVPEDDTLVQFVWDSASKVLNIGAGEGAGPVGNLKDLKAHWVTADTIAWDVDTETAETFALHYSPTGTPSQPQR